METNQANIHNLYNYYIFYMKTTNRKLFVYEEGQIDMAATAAPSLGYYTRWLHVSPCRCLKLKTPIDVSIGEHRLPPSIFENFRKL